MARLKEYYVKDVAPALMKKFGYKSVMQIPKLDKIVINVTCGEVRDNAKGDGSHHDRPVMPSPARSPWCARPRSLWLTLSCVRACPLAWKVTLRGERMYEFLDRLFNVALPRVRDFRGINPNSFDGRGNYNMGLKGAADFSEIEYDKIDKVRGMDLCFVTTASNDEEARELLTLMGAPFAK